MDRIDLYPVDSAISFPNTNKLDSALVYPMDSAIQRLNNQGAGLKIGVKNELFWSEIGSGFGEPYSTPSSKVPKSIYHPTPFPRLAVTSLDTVTFS